MKSVIDQILAVTHTLQVRIFEQKSLILKDIENEEITPMVHFSEGQIVAYKECLKMLGMIVTNEPY